MAGCATFSRLFQLDGLADVLEAALSIGELVERVVESCRCSDRVGLVARQNTDCGLNLRPRGLDFEPAAYRPRLRENRGHNVVAEVRRWQKKRQRDRRNTRVYRLPGRLVHRSHLYVDFLRFDLHRVRLDPPSAYAEQARSRGYVELPAVPGTLQHPALEAEVELARRVRREHGPPQGSPA